MLQIYVQTTLHHSSTFDTIPTFCREFCRDHTIAPFIWPLWPDSWPLGTPPYYRAIYLAIMARFMAAWYPRRDSNPQAFKAIDLESIVYIQFHHRGTYFYMGNIASSQCCPHRYIWSVGRDSNPHTPKGQDLQSCAARQSPQPTDLIF